MMLFNEFNLQQFSPVPQAKCLIGGRDFIKQLLELIDSANLSIHLQTYIFNIDNDNTGMKILEHLKLARSRGVSVHILVDSFGSQKFTQSVAQELINLGFNFRWFNPFFGKKSHHWGRRLHHKIVLFDNNSALVGGINIGDEFLPWFDMAILIVGSSTIIDQLLIIALQYYEDTRSKKIISPILENNIEPTNLLMRVCVNDWMKLKDDIFDSYVTSIKSAKKNILLVNGYFLPGRKILKALYAAAKRGVVVTIVLSTKTDIPYLSYAQQFLYPQMKEKGLKIFHWNSSILHAKLAIIDDEWLSIGSFNLNFIAYYGDIETNIEVYNTPFVSEFKTQIEQLLLIGAKKFDHSTIHSRIACLIFYCIFLMIRWMSLLTINFKGRKVID